MVTFNTNFLIKEEEEEEIFFLSSRARPLNQLTIQKFWTTTQHNSFSFSLSLSLWKKKRKKRTIKKSNNQLNKVKTGTFSIQVQIEREREIERKKKFSSNWNLVLFSFISIYLVLIYYQHLDWFESRINNFNNSSDFDIVYSIWHTLLLPIQSHNYIYKYIKSGYLEHFPPRFNIESLSPNFFCINIYLKTSTPPTPNPNISPFFFCI